MDVAELHRRTTEAWIVRVVEAVDASGERPTPCSDWNVRELINHVVGEDRWTPPLMNGRTIADIGSTLDGDLLGDDPLASARSAAEAAIDSVTRTLPLGRPVHLSYGDESPTEYVMQLATDHLIHGWDLAAAVGGSTALDAELVDEVAAWFAEREDAYRGAGVIGERPGAGFGGGAQEDLLLAFGRDPGWHR